MGHCPGAQHYVYLKQSRSIRYCQTVEDGKKIIGELFVNYFMYVVNELCYKFTKVHNAA